MGYDCTLHLVDERAIREEFIPKLLGRSRKKTALERVLKNAAELWATVRTLLDGDEPEEAAAALCQLAVTFSACSLPHQYERGFALSRWENQEKDIAVKYPAKFAFSPEPLFAEVVAEYPGLRGQFPIWFLGNYSTGVYIPAAQVPQVLAWVEKKIAKFAKGDQRHFKGLLGILRAAAAKQLAYWEATDLAVPMAGHFPGDPKLMLAHYLGNEQTTPSQQLEKVPCCGSFNRFRCWLLDSWLISTDDTSFKTSFWDLATWPPQLQHTLPGFVYELDHARDGRWVLFSVNDRNTKPRKFRAHLYSALDKQPEAVLPVLSAGTEPSLDMGVFVAEQLLAFRGIPFNAKAGDQLPPPRWWQDEAWKPAPGLRAATARRSIVRSLIDEPQTGVVRLEDGADVLIWDCHGYELRGKRFVPTFTLETRPAQNDTWTYAPAGGDGFFYLSDRKLFEVHRDHKGIAHAKQWTNIMYIGCGPAASILLKEGENKDGDVAKLYFPADGTFIHIEPELFDDKDYPFIHWSQATDRFIVLAGDFLAVSTATVLALPRYRVSTGRQVKG